MPRLNFIEEIELEEYNLRVTLSVYVVYGLYELYMKKEFDNTESSELEVNHIRFDILKKEVWNNSKEIYEIQQNFEITAEIRELLYNKIKSVVRETIDNLN